MKPELMNWRNNPFRVMLALILIIAIVESLIMYLFSMIKTELSPTAVIFIDSSLLISILCPVFYFLVVFPLLEQISERSAADSALRTSKIRFRQLLDSVEGIVWEADPRSFAFTFVSRKAESILGYPVERWLEEPNFWAEHLHPEDREWAMDYSVSASRELHNHVFEYRMVAADGRVVWLRDLVTVMVEAGEARSLRGLMVDISEKKAIGLALAASEKRYQFLADNLHDVIWEIDENLCYSYVSGSVNQLLGYRAEELIGQPFGVVLTERSMARAMEIMKVVSNKDLSGNTAPGKMNHEFECLRKDGYTFWVEVNATLFIAEDKKIKAVVGSTKDISDRKLAEIEMKSAHDLLQKTINTLNEAVIIVDSNTRMIKDLNLATEKMFDYSREELLGADISMLHFSAELYQRFNEKMLTGFAPLCSFTTKLSMKKKSGWVFPSEQSLAPIISEDGICHLHVCVVRDISAQQLHEEQLARAYNMVAERNAFVESVITNIQSCIIVLDREFRITMINPYAAAICRRDADELMGLHLQEICPDLFEQVADECSPDEMIATFFGNSFIIGYACFRIHDANGRVTGTILTFKDLTEIVRIRNDIRQKQRLSAMGEVVARVAHEMRNPLFGMTAAGQILNMELSLNNHQQLLMDSFLKEARRLNNLVDELLDSTREVRLVKKNINLVNVLNDSLRLVTVNASDKDVAVKPEYITGEIPVNADPDKLEQVLLNLLKNGIEACQNGGRVDLSVAVEGMFAVVKVVDNGSGIAEDVMESIFDVFYTTKKNGTGMGLSISRNIIEAHDGELTAFNNEMDGASFVMKLPLQVVDT